MTFARITPTSLDWEWARSSAGGAYEPMWAIHYERAQG
jgi:hypothetical protein